jgi:hypothetical protein
MASRIFSRSTIPIAAKFTACNRVWVASVNVMRGVLERNHTLISAAYQLIHSTLVLAHGAGAEGVQMDQSFHQHGSQLYTGWGYGGIWTTNILVLESYAQGTTWSMAEGNWSLFVNFLLTGHKLSSHGPNWDYSACGRLMTYFAAFDKYHVGKSGSKASLLGELSFCIPLWLMNDLLKVLSNSH